MRKPYRDVFKYYNTKITLKFVIDADDQLGLHDYKTAIDIAYVY